MDIKAKTKTFRCDCNWPRHTLQVCADFLDSDDYPYLCVSVMNEQDRFLGKLKSCWKILTGNEEYLSEIIIHREEVGEFVTFINEVCKVTHNLT